MDIYASLRNHEIRPIPGTDGEFEMVLRIDGADAEFASEAGGDPGTRDQMTTAALNLIKERYPKLRITLLRIMVGGTMLLSIPVVAQPGTVSASADPATISVPTAVHAPEIVGASAAPTAPYGPTTPRIELDGTPLPVKGTIINNQTFVPIRAVAESLGAQVGWDGATGTVTIRQGDVDIRFQVGSNVAFVNGRTTAVPASLIQDGTTLVPLRFISETLGLRVDWDDASRTVRLTTPESVGASSATSVFYSVAPGDTLWSIARANQTTVDAIKQANRLATDALLASQRLVIPKAFHQVAPGQSLWSISKLYGVPVDALKAANRLTGDMLQVGQTLVVPKLVSPPTAPAGGTTTAAPALGVAGTTATAPAPTTPPTTTAAPAAPTGTTTAPAAPTTTAPAPTATPAPAPTASAPVQRYTVATGDTLWNLANRFGTTVDAIRSANGLVSDSLFVGQTLSVPAPAAPAPAAPTPAPATALTGTATITYQYHTIRSGDNLWNISVNYGVPFLELLKANNMTESSRLTIGQTIRIPVHHIPVKPVVSAKHGELLDWWTEARYVFSTGKVATVTDFKTGRTFQVKHTMGGNHADSEPMTARDAQIMKEIWGGSYSWTPRAVIIEVDGRRLAAAMHSMPHGDQAVSGNNYEGHFCIHFLNSQRHSDGQVQESMQQQIRIAAGQTSL